MEEVQKEAEAIILESQKEAKGILRTYQEEAARQYTAILNEEEINAETERKKIESLTEVETRNRLLKKKEQLVNAAFDKALEQLTAFTQTGEYYAYLLKLIEDTAKKLDSKNLILHLNAADKKRIVREDFDKLSQKLGVRISLAETSEACIGGCKLETPDKRTLYDNTFENRLQQFKTALRVAVARILFGKEGQENAG